MLPFALLVDSWRIEADRLRKYGAEGQATALESCASELAAAEREFLFETLTLEQAATASGLSYDTLSRKVRRGEIPNSGRKGKPLVRRCDLLPGVAPPGPRPVTDHGEPDIAEQLLRDRA